MSKVDELRALNEMLDVCYADLNKLLKNDHPPSNHLQMITKERQTIDDIEYLIADVKAEIAGKELRKYMMNEFKITYGMKQVHI
jgi:hypothetical protein